MPTAGLRGGGTIHLPSKHFASLLERAIGTHPGAVATVDHVFASPPLRVVDSHHRLMSVEPLLVLYDVTMPDMTRYRGDLIVDAGVAADRNPEFHLWSSDRIFAKTPVRRPNFEAQTREVNAAVRKWPKLDASSKDLIMERWVETCALCLRCVEEAPESATRFYLKWLPALYRLCGWERAASFIEKTLIGFYNGALLRQYIPMLIEETRNTRFGLGALERHSTFEHRLFRLSDEAGESSDLSRLLPSVEVDSREMVDAIASGSVIPSAEVCSWAVALAGIPHFGNDRGFFKKLEQHLEQLGVRNNIGHLQLTEGREDGRPFLEFQNPKLLRINVEDGKAKLRAVTVKRSRYGSIPTIYVRFGKEVIQNLWLDYWEHGRVARFDS